MFRTAVLRLTFWYLLLIMTVSAAFSGILFASSTRELHDLEHRQLVRSQDVPFVPPLIAHLNAQHTQQIEDSLERIKLALFYFNAAILLLGGAASYLLARRTLGPIEIALEAQSRFASDASHELRTPLTAIKTELEVALRDRSLNLERSKELHRSTLEEIAKLEALAAGLLALAQPDAAAEPLNLQQCRVDELIADAQKRLAATALTRHIRIVADPSGLTILTECWAVTEALAILLDNAVKYSSEDSEVRVTAEMRHHGQVSIAVVDTGIGIASSELPHIFDRFWRSDQARAKQHVGGYGLGLSIAEKIMLRLNGDITVKSVVGEGSQFTLLLPAGR